MKQRSLMKVLSVFTALTMMTSPLSVLGAQVSDEAEFEEAIEEAGEEVASVEDEAEVDGALTISEAAGYEEGAYAEWAPVSGASSYSAYVKKGSGDYEEIDDELIRQYSDHWRVDVLGLTKGSDYKIKVVAEGANAEAETEALNVYNYDRTGFAFSSKAPIDTREALGAYNKDGSLRTGAKVIYVTNETAKTVKASIQTDSKGTMTEAVGLQSIIALLEKDANTTPLDIRIVGTIYADHMDAFGSSEEGLQIKGKAYSNLNLTIEGVGEDSGVHGFGMLLRSAGNVEIRNLAFMNFMDDGVSVDTKNCNLWIHNNDFFYGSAGGDADQAKGDGSLDTKGKSTYITESYNHFWDSGKTHLCGMKSEATDCAISFHHNWFDHSDSRHPRVRTMTVHVYNNYFDGNSKYGVGATMGSSVFVEQNYFRNCKYPMLASKQGTDAKGDGTFSGENGGLIKAYGNIFGGNATYLPYSASNTTDFDAYPVANRSDTVPATVKTLAGGTTYNNFDTSSGWDLGVTAEQIDAAADVPSIVMGKKTAEGKGGAGRHAGGDLWWNFDNETADTSYAIDSALKSAVVNYKTSIKSIGGSVSGATSDNYDPDKDETEHKERSETDNASDTHSDTDSSNTGGNASSGSAKNLYSFVASSFVKDNYATLASDHSSETIPDGTKYKEVFTLNKCTIPGKKLDVIGITANGGQFIIDVDESAAGGTLTFSLAGSGSGNTSKDAVMQLLKGGTAVANSKGETQFTVNKTDTAASVIFKDLEKGEYVLCSTSSEGGQCRVKTATVSIVSDEEDDDPEPEPETQYYNVSVTPAAGVSTSFVGGTYEAGADVEFSTVINDGYKLTVTAKKADGSAVRVSDQGEGEYSFTMPKADVTVSFEATLIEYQTVTFKSGETVVKTVKVEKGTSIAAADVPAAKAPAGKVFAGWMDVTGGIVDVTKAKISEDAEFAASFTDKPSGATVLYIAEKAVESGGTEHTGTGVTDTGIFKFSGSKLYDSTAVTVDGVTYSGKTLKMESKTEIGFTTTEACKMTIITDKNVKITGGKYSSATKVSATSNKIVYEDMPAGDYKLTKGDVSYVYAIILEYASTGGSSEGHTVTAVLDSNVHVNFESGVKYDPGKFAFEVYADEGYEIASVKNGETGLGSEAGAYEIDLTADATITVTQKSLSRIDVRKSNVTVEGISSGYYGNEEITFKVKPLAGYDSVSVNVVTRGGSSETLTGTPDAEDASVLVFKYTPAGNALVEISAEPIGVTDLSIVDEAGKVYADSDVIEVGLGDSKVLKAKLLPEGANMAVSWNAVNPDTAEIITVNGGIVKGQAVGEASLTVAAGKVTKTYKVKVASVDVESVTIRQGAELTMEAGTTKKLSATVSPNNASYKTVTWTSDNEAVATVEGGTVKALKEGVANITAKAGEAGREKSATIKITVTAATVAGKVPTAVTLDKSDITIVVGGKEKLTATIEPADADDKTVTWKTSDLTVAAVNAEGEVTGMKVGTAKITVTTINGKTAEANVTVSATSPKITIEPTSKALKVGSTTELKATVTGTSNKEVIWTSSDAKVASVDANGKVTALAKGTATIKAALKADESVYAEAVITVTEEDVVEVASVRIDPADDITMNLGDIRVVSAVVEPGNATIKTVIWSSSDESVASVKEGTISANGVGTAIITAAAGDKSASIKVTVESTSSIDVPTVKKAPIPELKDPATGAAYEVAMPDYVEYTGGKITIDDQINIGGKKVGEEIAPGILFAKIKYKDNQKIGQAKVTILLKATSKDQKKQVKAANKAMKQNPFTFEIRPRNLSGSAVKVEGTATYKSKGGKWSFKLTANIDGVKKPLKLKYSRKDARTDFIPDAAYDGNADTVTLTGMNSFRGTVTIPVTKK